MKPLAMVILFIVCSIGAAFHESLHIARAPELALIVGAVIAFIIACGENDTLG